MPNNTEQHPIQKFYWKDVYARLIAEEIGNRKFRYKVVPLEGGPGDLVPMTTVPFMVSNEVEISSTIDANINAYFNRGFISTQRLTRYFEGKPAKTTLENTVSDIANPLRARMSGDMVEALT